MSFDAVVIGRGGHVGPPLAIMLSSRAVNTAIYDTSEFVVEGINAGKMPFWEPGAEITSRINCGWNLNYHDRPFCNRKNGFSVCGYRDTI